MCLWAKPREGEEERDSFPLNSILEPYFMKLFFHIFQNFWFVFSCSTQFSSLLQI